MKRLVRLSLAVAALTVSGTAIASFSSMVFTRDDPAAIIMVEEAQQMQDGTLIFQKVDLTTMRSTGVPIQVNKRVLQGRLITGIAGLRITNFPPYNNHSRFSAAKKKAGDYALVGYTGYDWLLGPVHGCPHDGAPVFRFKAGQANLITAEMLPWSSAERQPLAKRNFDQHQLAANGSTDAVGDAQQVLDERKGIKTDVIRAEYLGRVVFDGEIVKRDNSCGAGNHIRMLPE